MEINHDIDATNEMIPSKPSGFPLLELMGEKSRLILEAAGMNKNLPVLFSGTDTKPQALEIIHK